MLFVAWVDIEPMETGCGRESDSDLYTVRNIHSAHSVHDLDIFRMASTTDLLFLIGKR